MFDNAAEETPAMRLRRAREAAGWPTAREFCRRNGLTVHTYYSHERGHRAFNAEAAKQYAALLRTSPSALLYGGSLRENVTVPIVGSIGDGGRVTMADLLSSVTVALGEAAGMEGIVVQGHSLYPAYRDGDHVFYHPLIAGDLNIRELHGIECVVELLNGERLVRQIFQQPDGRVTLNGYNVPPMYDVAITAASPVELVRRARPSRR